MKLRHATPESNLGSIMQKGLDPMYAITESDQRWVWLHTPQRTSWAIPHTVRRKKITEDEIVILEISVPKTWLCRAWRGVWKCPKVIPPERLRVLESRRNLEPEGVSA